jgi:hypothetical protein
MNLQANRGAAKRTVNAALAVFAFAFAPLEQASAAAGGVYVSTQSSDLGQTFGQALAENPARARTPFWIVVAGPGVARMTRKDAGAEVTDWMKTVRARGGIVYVCRSDMLKTGIKEEDLLDGVAPMYGYGAKDWAGLLPARKDNIVLPDNQKQSRLILKTCAEGETPSS